MPKKVTDEDAIKAWNQYVFESSGSERGSVREAAAWDRYMAVLRTWRNQA